MLFDTRCGFTLGQLDEMEQTVKLPKCWRTLHPRFFQERVDMPVRGHDCEGHVKAFSNEVLAGTQILHTLYHLLEIPPEICEMFDTLRQVYNLFLIRDMLRRPGKMSILLQHRHMLDANLFHLCNKFKLYLAVDLLCLQGEFTVNARAVILTRRCFTLKQLNEVAQAVKLPKC